MLSDFLVSSSLKMKPGNDNEKLINLDQHTRHHIQEYRNRYNHRLDNLYRILFSICTSCTYWLTLYFNLLNRGSNLHRSRIESLCPRQLVYTDTSGRIPCFSQSPFYCVSQFIRLVQLMITYFCECGLFFSYVPWQFLCSISCPDILSRHNVTMLFTLSWLQGEKNLDAKNRILHNNKYARKLKLQTCILALPSLSCSALLSLAVDTCQFFKS